LGRRAVRERPKTSPSGRVLRRAILEVARDELDEEVGAARIAGHLIDHLPTLEQEQGRDRTDLIGQRCPRVFVDVEFHDPQLTGHARRDGLKVWDEGSTGAGPYGPEIHQNQRLGFENVVSKAGVGDAEELRHRILRAKNGPGSVALASPLLAGSWWTEL